MKTILLSLLLFLLSQQTTFENRQSSIKNHQSKIQNDTTYEYSIRIIKKYEKYSATRYPSLGDEYIGYGHLLYAEDTITYMSKMQADSQARCDFNEAIDWVNEHIDGLPLNQKHVLAMLVFNIKHGDLNESILFKLIRQKEPYQAIQERYYRYAFAGKKFLPGLKKRRIDEFKIW